MKWSDWIGLYGAGLATLIAVFEIIKYLMGRPGLKITVGKKTNWYFNDASPSVESMHIIFVNSGDVPITLQDTWLEFEKRVKHNSLPVSIPGKYITITKGQQPVQIQVPSELLEKRRILRAWAIDTTGKKYRSKVHPYVEPQ